MADPSLIRPLAIVLALGACGPAGTAVGPETAPTAGPAPAHGAAPPPSGHAELPDRAWAPVSSARHSLELLLPERETWFVDDQATLWLVARHAATRSELVARTWRAGRLVSREDCERQARLWRPAIPTPSEETVMERRALAVPVGFSTELVVGVAPLPKTAELQGYALAFGSTTGRCFAFVYTTLGRGAGADMAVGRRLAIVADEIVPQIRMRGIDERVR